MTVTIVKNRRSLGAGQYHDDLGKSHYETGTYPHKKHLQVLIRPGQSVQNREINFLQTILHEKIKSGNDISFKNGSVIAGLQLTLVDNGDNEYTASFSEGVVYWDGMFRQVASFDVNFNVTDMTGIGSYKYLKIGLNPVYSIITDTTDSKLGDPSILYQTNQMIRGADRLYLDFSPVVCEMEYVAETGLIKKTDDFCASYRQLFDVSEIIGEYGPA